MYKVVVYHKQRDQEDGVWQKVSRSLVEKPGHLKTLLNKLRKEASRVVEWRPDNPIYTTIVIEEFVSTYGKNQEWTNEPNGENPQDRQLTLPGVE